jgi:hypothetical protein
MTADRGAEGAVLIGSDGSTHGSMRPAVQIIGATKASTHSDRCNHHHHQRRHALHATRPLLLFAAACVLGAAAGADGRELQAPLLVTAANWGYRSMTVNFVCRCVGCVTVCMPPHLCLQVCCVTVCMPPHLCLQVCCVTVCMPPHLCLQVCCVTVCMPPHLCLQVCCVTVCMPPHLCLQVCCVTVCMPPHLSSLPENQPLPLHAALCETAELLLHYGSHGCHHWLSGCALTIRWL